MGLGGHLLRRRIVAKAALIFCWANFQVPGFLLPRDPILMAEEKSDFRVTIRVKSVLPELPLC
jgi:hypothetical protein